MQRVQRVCKYYFSIYTFFLYILKIFFLYRISFPKPFVSFTFLFFPKKKNKGEVIIYNIEKGKSFLRMCFLCKGVCTPLTSFAFILIQDYIGLFHSYGFFLTYFHIYSLIHHLLVYLTVHLYIFLQYLVLYL